MLKQSFYHSLLLVLLMNTWAFSAQEADIRIAVLPFKINAEKDLSYLREGVADMFASRLTTDKSVIVVRLPADATENSTGVNDDSGARRIGQELKVDHVLYGSLTVFGDSISMDAKVMAMAGQGPAQVFSKQAPSADALIPAIQTAAKEIAAKLAGRPAVVSEALPKSEAQPLFSATTEQGERTFWKSQDFNLEIRGITAGDADGDGKTEVAFITTKELYVFRMGKDHLAQMAVTPAPSGLTLLCVDMADINSNGKAEIFITALNPAGDRMESLVVEWDGKANTITAKDLPWFFRIVPQSQKKVVLLAQKKGFDEPFESEIFEMSWKDGTYSPGKKLNLPSPVSVAGLAIGDLANDGRDVAAFLDKGDHLQLFLSSGERLWKSDEQYGGSESFIDYSTSGLREDTRNRAYIPQRIIAANAGQAAKNELLVVKNDSLTGRFFDRFRSYGTGWFERLVWDGIGMSSKGASTKITGYISDFYLIQQGRDGGAELLAAVVSERNSLIKDGKSTVIIYKYMTMVK